MCGLAGILSLSGRPIADAERRVRRMTDLLRYRGPDAQGVLVSDDGILALGNTRLAITDPNAPIELPLCTADRRKLISFNGEIYDFLDVRRELEACGVRFRHRTDTEVLLEGLRLYGEDLLRRLDGMWAFAYYDFDTRSLLLSRDVMGERHLFYRIDNNEMVFASEPLPILADRGCPEEIDFEGVVTALRYLSAPPSRTLVKGLYRLRPGHNLVATVGRGWKEYRYRRLHPEKWFDFFRSKPSLEKVIEVFEETLHRVTVRRLPPDVPFIATLSGGIDSTLVCVFASDLGRRQINTIYGQSATRPAQNLPSELDEYEASKLTSARLNTRHQHMYLNSNNGDFVPVLYQLAERGFDGMIDPGVALYEMLARQARRENTKVMLISDGPDELVGGYPKDKRAWEIDQIRANKPIRYTMLKALSSTRTVRRALKWLGWRDLIVSDVSYKPFHFSPMHEPVEPDYLRCILQEDQISAAAEHYGVIDHTYDDILPELDYTQLRALSYAAISLPDVYNLRTDKAFLKESVECRLPFQAPEIVEMLIALPAEMRFGNGNTTKFLMRKIVERRIGSEVAYRSKHGIGENIFATSSLRTTINFEEVLATSPIFRDLPFAPRAREIGLEPRAYRQWLFFVLAKTYEQLRNGRYVGVSP